MDSELAELGRGPRKFIAVCVGFGRAIDVACQDNQFRFRGVEGLLSLLPMMLLLPRSRPPILLFT